MSILDNAKQVAEAVHEIHNLELYKRVLSLHSDIIEIVEQNNRLRDENKELKETVTLTKAMIFRPPFFYQEGDPTPYCPACWEGNHKAAHVMFSHEEEACIVWNCPTCKHPYIINKTSRRRTADVASNPYLGENGWMG